MSDRCPTCKQKLPMGGQRICANCKKPMSTSHKHTYIPIDGKPGHYMLVHRNCDDPESYRIESSKVSDS